LTQGQSKLFLAAPHCSSLLLTAPHCSSLLLTAPHCVSLLPTAPHCSLLLTAPHCSLLLTAQGQSKFQELSSAQADLDLTKNKEAKHRKELATLVSAFKQSAAALVKLEENRT
jgi:hypothetical protein